MVSGPLYFLSSTLNPILYTALSKKYRYAFRAILCSTCSPPNAQASPLAADHRSYSTAVTMHTSSDRKRQRSLLHKQRDGSLCRTNSAEERIISNKTRLLAKLTDSFEGKDAIELVCVKTNGETGCRI